ncbi:MAG: TnpV protein [Lachnospiraceae bacterium]|nr:TnpV protein [Lachnospiraceae bacterium]
MKSLFEETSGTYRQMGDYFIPNLVLPNDGNYQIGKYGRMRRMNSIRNRAEEIILTELVYA